MIELTEQEKYLIKACKGTIRFNGATGIIDVLSKVYDETYGISSEHYSGWKVAMFEFMLRTYMKIKEGGSLDNHFLITLFRVTFHKTPARDHELPVERALAELYGSIQATIVKKDGITRFDLKSSDYEKY